MFASGVALLLFDAGGAFGGARCAWCRNGADLAWIRCRMTKGPMRIEMTPCVNALAILEGKRPEHCSDSQGAVKVVVGPVWKSGSIPEDGCKRKDSWGTVCVRPVESPGKHPMQPPKRRLPKMPLGGESSRLPPRTRISTGATPNLRLTLSTAIVVSSNIFARWVCSNAPMSLWAWRMLFERIPRSPRL